jgi:hypothetical protein
MEAFVGRHRGRGIGIAAIQRPHLGTLYQRQHEH